MCNSSIGQVQLELKPRLLDDVDEGIQAQLKKLLKSQICGYINSYVEKVEEKLMDLLRVSTIQLEVRNIEKNYRKYLSF